jgi:hypothetical protein
MASATSSGAKWHTYASTCDGKWWSDDEGSERDTHNSELEEKSKLDDRAELLIRRSLRPRLAEETLRETS